MSDKWTWKTAPQAPGGGIIILKYFNKEWLVFGMWARGGYDIPKGHIENGESPLETAIRECKEESDITNLNFRWGVDNIKLNKLVVYLASTEEDGRIIPNCKTGIYEHEKCDWLTLEEMKSKTYNYLKPAIEWAQLRVLDET
tara:strand:+ start:1189 stop:1614 length:426 start_codon:yes stop_codon:yes gene_type:complete